MAKRKKKYWLILGWLVFLIYVFVAARPIREENILVPRWLSSPESNILINLGGSAPEDGVIIPFRIGNRFGYLEDNGSFILNEVQEEGNLSFSPYGWSEYGTLPSSIDILDHNSRILTSISNPRGFPLFLDNRIFIIGNEQNSLSALNSRGETTWTYDFPAPLTCIDAASGFVLAGLLDGAVELLDAAGSQIYSFEPGGSRLAVVLGCAISQDGSMIGIVSGIDNQRFLALELSGDTYRVVYHEFLSAGFRRAVHIRFIHNDSMIAFEREGGIGIYDTVSRSTVTLPLEGEIMAMDTGDNKYLFAILSQEENLKRLVGIKLPDLVFINAPFRSKNIYLFRRNTKVYLGGDMSLASFELGKK